jgi:hypothetical protein
MKKYIIGVLGIILFFLFVGSKENKGETNLLDVSTKTPQNYLPEDTLPKFYVLEGVIDSECFDVYMSENIVSDGGYFGGIAVSKSDGIPHFFGGNLYFEGRTSKGCHDFLALREMKKINENQTNKKVYSFSLTNFGKNKRNFQISFIKNEFGNFEGILPNQNIPYPHELDKLIKFKMKTEKLEYNIIPKLIVSKNSLCGVGKEGWQDLMRFNFLEFNSPNFDNGSFLQTYCNEMKNSYKSYFYDYLNATDKELDKIQFGSTIYTNISFINSYFISGVYENNYISVKQGLNVSTPFLYSIKERKNLILSDVIKGKKEEITIKKILELAKNTSGIGNCLVNAEEIINARIFITFKGINLIFCSTNRSNRGFQGLFVFASFEELKDLLKDDFKSNIRN